MDPGSQSSTMAAEEFLDRMLDATVAALDLASIYLGERLGLYSALGADRGRRPADLAAELGLHERYVREWLEQQAATGILTVDDPHPEPADRVYRLPAGHAEVLLDGESPSFFGTQPRTIVGSYRVLPELLEAFRHGGGVAYDRYGAEFSEGLGLCNRASFVNLLGSEWLPAVADVDARLRSDPPARVADVACGTGWSSISIARAYPNARVDGFDLDAGSIALARENLARSGLGERITFEQRDAADPQLSGRYDLVTIFEALHDMPNPVGALEALRALLAPGGALIVMDENASERFEAPADRVQRLLYGYSVLHCLPVGMADQPSAGTGTVMRPSILRRYAREAGFEHVEILPIESDFWRFYRLFP
jgi:2-polyprenyl-3-methyl-5-hydroxy-6-metoxy-1,4-benzoquinol methylase